LVAKPAFLRPSITKYFDKPSFFYKLSSKPYNNTNILTDTTTQNSFTTTTKIDLKKPIKTDSFLEDSFKLLNTPLLHLKKELVGNNFLNYWDFSMYITKERRKKIILAKCPNSILTMSG